MGKIILALLLVGLIAYAVRSRVYLRRRRTGEALENAVPSPASVAMGELIAIAGGIYLSLILLVSFLKISMPDKIIIFSMSIDPLALIALSIAILQPVILSVYYGVRKS